MKSHNRFVRPAFGLALLAALVAAPLAAHAWDLSGPAAGRWSVALFEHDWARGEAIRCTNLTTGQSCTDNSLVGMDWAGPGDANNEISSFQVCNNTGAQMEIHVTAYRDADYIAHFDTHDFLVENGECVIRNLAVDDVLTSFYVQPQ